MTQEKVPKGQNTKQEEVPEEQPASLEDMLKDTFKPQREKLKNHNILFQLDLLDIYCQVMLIQIQENKKGVF